jgi:hypothetical protein
LIYKTAGAGTMNITGSSPNFAGGGYFNQSNVTLSGTLSNALGIQLLAGRFDVNGTLLGAGVTNFAGTALAGSGTISGAVDIGGVLVAGNVGVAGTLTTGELTLQPGVSLTNDLALPTTVGNGINDLYQVNGNLNLSGNDFYINRLDADLSNGTYTLATYTCSFNGALGTVYLIGDAGSYNLTLHHVTTASPKRIDLIVTGGVNLPPNLTAAVSGGQMMLSWPANYTGWQLQAQTNTLGVGLGANWSTVAGSAAVNQLAVPIDPANPAVFFRLINP